MAMGYSNLGSISTFDVSECETTVSDEPLSMFCSYRWLTVAGGMPSPTCRIPITVRRSLWLEPTESQALIPSSIGAGESVTLDDPIKVLIRASDVPPSLGSLFIEQDTLSLAAQMPWLNRELPHFEYRRTLSIQYPVELRGFNVLKTMAQGSTSRFAFEVSHQTLHVISIN